MYQFLLKFLGVSPAVIGVSLVVTSPAMASEPPKTINPVTVMPLVQAPPRLNKFSLSSQQQPEEQGGYGERDESVVENSDATTSVQNSVKETASVLEQIDSSSNDPGGDDPMSQVTSVSQLRDVQPDDWAYEAVRLLVERYGIITGYPDGTFRGNRPMSRYEFAASLNVVLARINQLVTTGSADKVSRQDLAVLRRLRDQFTLELALLRGRVDAVTARIAEVELTQFSNTTKLQGDIIFAGVGAIAGNANEIDKQTIFGSRSRLNLETSFTGRDLLLTRLQAEGLGSLTNKLTPEGDLAFTGDTDSNVKIDTLLYKFPVGKKTQVVLAGNAVEADDFTNTVNPYLDGDGDSGALSNFGTRASIYYLVEGAGVAITHTFSDNLELSLGYLASNSANPAAGGGLFNGSYGALAQLVFQPSERSSIGLTYVHAYNNDLNTGSNNANLFSQLGLPVVSNSIGVEASFQISPQLALGGWAGYTAAHVLSQGDAKIWNWAVTLAFPDLGKKGNLGGVVIGMEPKVTSQDSSLSSLSINDPDTSLHLEAFYQYKLTDNIVVTPGIIWLTAPDHNNANADIVIGAVRTTFSF